MKIEVCFLLVAISCLFHPAVSSCRKRCSSRCRQSQINDFNCLKNAMIRNPAPIVQVMANFLCTYDRFKTSNNKGVILRSVGDIQAVSGCELGSLVALDTSIAETSADVNGVFIDVLRAVYDNMMLADFDNFIVPGCLPVKQILTKVSRILVLYSVPTFNGPFKPNIEVNQLSRFLAEVQIRNPRVSQALLEMFCGPSLAREMSLIIAGLRDMVNDIGSMVYGTTTASQVRGSNGLIGSITEIVPPVVDLVNNVVDSVGNVLGSVTHSVQGVTDLLGGPNGLVGGSLLSGVVGDKGIITGTLNNVLGGSSRESGSKSGLLGGVLGKGGLTKNLLSTATGLVANTVGGRGGEGGILNNVVGGGGGILGNLLGGGGGGGILGNLLGGGGGIIGGLLGGGASPSIAEDSGRSTESGERESGSIASLNGNIRGDVGENIGVSASGNIGLKLGNPVLNSETPRIMPTEYTVMNGGSSILGNGFSRPNSMLKK